MFVVNIKIHSENIIKHVDGVEFDKISRGTLLQILSAFEDNIKSSTKWAKEKPLFKAKFSNNKHTYPHLYPPSLIKKLV
ncbi:unnamed protein product [Leptidea sinapis]|uniref:Uncharacterized protein n=1 Tax=Leptidea sinapis TaxID=189913 RepID=A0A5E4R074_9NEOP|nr:unnamed protein product [Leptidea sinapis]